MAQLRLRDLQIGIQIDARDIAKDLRDTPLLNDLRDSHGALERLSELIFEHTFGAGEILIQEAQLQESLWIFVEGRASMFSKTSGGLKLAILDGESKDSFGAASLIQPEPSELSVIAETAGKYYVLDGMALDQFSREFPEAAFKLQATFSRSLLRQLKKAQENLRLLQLSISRVS